MQLSLRPNRGWALACLAFFVPALAQEDSAAKIARLFAPFSTDMASLSPDAKYLAYGLHQNGSLSLMLLELASNKAKRVALSDDYVEPMSGLKEKLASRLTFLRWKNANRLVFSIDDNLLWAMNGDGTEPRRLIGARNVRTDWKEKRERSPVFNRMAGGAGSGARRMNTPDMSADTSSLSSLLGTNAAADGDTVDPTAIESEDTADVFGAFALAWKTDRYPVVADMLDDDP
ncbi:MAG: hypothetical protein RIQ93_3001, partial [Verrucomicrobiota bacterium]